MQLNLPVSRLTIYVSNQTIFIKIGLKIAELHSVLFWGLHLSVFVYLQIHRCVLNTYQQVLRIFVCQHHSLSV